MSSIFSDEGTDVAGHVILQHRTGVWTLEVEAPSRFADGDRNCDSDGNLN
jgi:hypothetical protein